MLLELVHPTLDLVLYLKLLMLFLKYAYSYALHVHLDNNKHLDILHNVVILLDNTVEKYGIGNLEIHLINDVTLKDDKYS